jgi:hypothetical protein
MNKPVFLWTVANRPNRSLSSGRASLRESVTINAGSPTHDGLIVMSGYREQPGAPFIARFCAMGGLHSALSTAEGRSGGATETTELHSSTRPCCRPGHPKPVKPPRHPKTHKTPMNIGDKSFRNLA